jgi:type IV secretory pathway VirB10-like protein
LTALAAACIGAAGVGGYLATRHNVANIAAPEAAAASSSKNPQPVQETEALIGAAAKPAPETGQAPAALTSSAQTSSSAPANKRMEPGSPTRPAAQIPKPAASASRQAAPPSLDRSWPSSQPQAPSSAPSSTESQNAPITRAEDHPQDAARIPEPPAKTYAELVVAADSVVGLRTDTSLSSERARVEDRVEAHVVRDVRVGGEVAIPAGARALGTVVAVDRGGKFKERARLGIRFQTLVLADGTRLPITTETIYRFGNPPANASAAKIGGGAVVGAIIGGIIGGGKGAAIGATTGAGAGTASVMTSDRDEAVFPSGAEVTARILSPVTVTVERE